MSFVGLKRTGLCRPLQFSYNWILKFLCGFYQLSFSSLEQF